MKEGQNLMLAKTSLSDLFVAVNIEAVLAALIPAQLHKLEAQLTALREKRAPFQERSREISAAVLSQPSAGNKLAQKEIAQQLADVDREIAAARSRLQQARADLSDKYVGAVKAELVIFRPLLIEMADRIDDIRAVWGQVHRHAARHGLSTPAACQLVPDSSHLRMLAELLGT